MSDYASASLDCWASGLDEFEDAVVVVPVCPNNAQKFGWMDIVRFQKVSVAATAVHDLVWQFA